MAINVRTNVAAGGALGDLNKTTRALGRSFERISSGLRIARAADDAAGLGVAENLRAAHTSAAVAARNINDGLSAISVAEGATNEVANIMIRMRELAVQGSNGVLGETERSYIETEMDTLVDEIERISGATTFNGVELASSANPTLDVQVGIGDDSGGTDVIAVSFMDLGTTTTFASLEAAVTALSSASTSTFQDLIGALDTALDSVNTARAQYGAAENRLNSALNSIETFGEATRAAESSIRDADFGYETAQLSANQILQQAGTTVLAQAKNINQAALSLLQ
jgi:flagellin